MASLDEAGEGDASFLGNEKYHPQFEKTRASAVIVGRGETGGPETCALISVENPTLAFSEVVRHFAAGIQRFETGIHETAFVHPSAEVDPASVCIQAGASIMAGAKIGSGTVIAAGVYVGEQCVIGADCRLMANSVVRERCVLGDRVTLQPGVVIGSDGFGYQLVEGRHQKIEQVGTVEIGDDVEIGANSTIDRARFGKTKIGEGTKIDNLVQIGHNVTIGKHCVIVALTGVSGSTQIGNYVTLAGQVGTVGHIRIGDGATLTGRAAATTDIPAGEVYSGRPARPFKEDMKMRAQIRRLPKLIERVKALEAAAGLHPENE